MKLRVQQSHSGIALIIVMICVAVLATLAAGFAYRMNVENRLVRNANAEANFYALAQSGVDYCKSVLAASATCPEEVWNGAYQGSCSNAILDTVRANNYRVDLGYGRFSFSITNLEAFANINTADQPMLDQATRLMGLDAGDAGAVSAAILDWIDRDKNPHVDGAESDYYESLDPPYKAKDGLIDDLSELMKVRGIDRESFGLGEPGPPPPPPNNGGGFDEPPLRRATWPELFTAISSGQININTASPEVFQLFPFIDQNIADRIIWYRNGQDTGQPIPFRSVDELINVPGINSQMVPQMRRYFIVRGITFAVHLDLEIDGLHRFYTSVLRRNGARDIQVLTFYWTQPQ